MEKSRFWQVAPMFFPGAEEMRVEYQERFSEPREAREERFVWDYWHIPNQYTLVRTPAYHFFSEELWEEFSQHLIAWGQENLGCQDISPAWLSYYVEGCHQELHADIPHGPWAFVFSLTPWEGRPFSGGETMILKPEILNYWRKFDYEAGLEFKDLVQTIAPEFNQLTVFDPRLPHGVKEVRGCKDPLRARLVIHGWFTNPSPFVTGGLEEEINEETLDELLEPLHAPLGSQRHWTGSLILKLHIAPSGELESIKILCNNLVSDTGSEDQLLELTDTIQQHLKKKTWAKADSPTQLTIPFFF
jgi:hypothetical protein